MDLRERSANSATRHPWEVARLDFVARLLGERGLPTPDAQVLDVGSGDGWLIAQLAAANPSVHFVCVDAFYCDADIAALERVNVRAMRRAPDRRFDLITALDVVEHVGDDRAFLGELVGEQLADNGHVLITVPAWQSLWTAHDVQLAHHRRYSPRALASLIADCGLVTLSTGGFFHSLLGPRAMSVVREKTLGARLAHPAESATADEAAVASWRAPDWVTRVVSKFLAIDNAITRAFARANIKLPGLSLWALCRTRR